MIKHCLCVKLKNNSESEKQKVKELFLSMKGKVPQVKDIEVGVDFLGSERSYDVILIVTMDSAAELEAYQLDEYHCQTVKTYIAQVREAAVAVDFEV